MCFFWRLHFETWIFGVLGLGFWSFDFGGLDLGGFGLLISFVHVWKVLWVWSGFLGKVLEEMLGRVWGETIADPPVQEMILFLCGVFWEDSWVWSGWCGGFRRGYLWESGRKPLQTPLLGNALEFVLVPVSIFVRWFGGASRGLKWFPCEVYGKYVRGNHYRPSTPRNCCKDWISEFKSWSLILGLGFWILEFGFLILVCVFFLEVGFWNLNLRCFGAWILECWFWTLDFWFWILGIVELGFWNINFGVWILNLGFWMILVDFC